MDKKLLDILVCPICKGRLVHDSGAAELICKCTAMETLRFTTSGSLGTFYSVVLARASVGDCVGQQQFSVDLGTPQPQIEGAINLNCTG